MTAGPSDEVVLPARLSQPARLNFRWLAAEVGRIETNAHPLTTPVCGWLLPNNLDRSLMVSDNPGNSPGYLEETGHGRGPAGRPGSRAPGAPRWAVRAVELFELLLGATLVSGLAQRQLPILALVTLVVFTLLLVRQLRSGD